MIEFGRKPNLRLWRALHGRIFACVAAAWLASPEPARAFDLDIDPQIVKALVDLADEFPEYQDAENALQTALRNIKPNSIINFSDLAAKARATAADLRQQPAPPFDGWSKYSVSLDDLRGCLTYDNAMIRLRADRDSLNSQIQDATSKLKTIDQGVQQAHASYDAAKFLDDNFRSVVWVPIWGTMFLGDYLSVDSEVIPAFGAVITATTDYRSRFAASLAKAQLQLSNLTGNISGFSGLNPLVGSFAAAGGNGQVSYNPGTYNRTTVTLSNVSLRFSIGNDVRLLSGTIVAHDVYNITVPGFPIAPIADDYSLTQANGSLALTTITIGFVANNGAPPTMSAQFDGTISNDCKIAGSIVIRRTNNSPAMVWAISVPMTAVRQ